MISVGSQPCDRDHDAVTQDKSDKPTERNKMNGSGHLPMQQFAEPASFVGDCWTLHQARKNRDWCRHKNGDEVGKLLQAVVARPSLI